MEHNDLRQAIVAEARTWIRTPFMHMGRVKHVGVDCVGLVLCTAAAVGIVAEDVKKYPRFPINGIFGEHVDKQTLPVDIIDLLPGDLMKFQWTYEPQHLAIITQVNPICIVHAYSQVGMCVETDFDAMWAARFTDARRFKELA